MTTEFPKGELDRIAARVNRLAGEAYQEFLRLIDQGVTPQVAIARVQATFDAGYYAALAAAFSEILARPWTVAEVKAYRVGAIPLSGMLYNNWRRVSAHVASIVRDHVKGLQQARELALELYEGYNFRPPGTEPLQIADKLRQLPLPLRLIARDPRVRQAIMVKARRAASSSLRSQALKSAYLQAFDAAIAGATRSRLRQMLDVAMHEKVRYFANRIAQTELARTHADRVAHEFMADTQLEVVQWRLSASHPVDDICDVLANVDRFGLGPGCYPKQLAPKPPAHPFCRCHLRSRPDLRAADARENPGAERAMLARHSEPAAARMVGSRERLRMVKGGASVVDAWNLGGKNEYAIRTLGEAVSGPSSKPGRRRL